MDLLTIQEIKDHELNDLRKLAINTFLETYADANVESNMDQYISDSFSEIKLREDFHLPYSFFFFGKVNHQTAGYLKVNIHHTDDCISLEIERIYVLNQFQGKKIGKGLFEKAIEIAQNFSAAKIWLGVWDKNTKAIEFYNKMGLREVGTEIFIFGEEKQEDIIMELNLTQKQVI